MAAAILETVRAEALFVSEIGYSDALSADVVRDAVMDSVHRYGPRGCAELVARAFAEQPEAAAPRMSWALSALRTIYPALRPTRPWTPSPSPLAA